jgi:hypothetical protein
MLFRGKQIMSNHVPADYLPVWFGITLPETYLIAFVCGLIEIARAVSQRSARLPRQLFALGLLAAFVAFPVLAVWIVHPVIYDAQRHFLFLLPPLAALAGVALARFFADPALSKALRRMTGCALAAVAALVIFDMASLHPYEYIYFNRLSGGLPAARGRFETDYWGATYREGFAWLVEHYGAELGTRRIRVAGCKWSPHVEYYVQHWPDAARKFRNVNPRDARFYLALTRRNCDESGGRVIHVVERQGVPLLYVFER